jgi:hypothetical protein
MEPSPAAYVKNLCKPSAEHALLDLRHGVLVSEVGNRWP